MLQFPSAGGADAFLSFIATVYDSFADALEAAGRLEAARDRVQEAVRRGEANKDPLTEGFRQHLARLQAKLKGKS